MIMMTAKSKLDSKIFILNITKSKRSSNKIYQCCKWSFYSDKNKLLLQYDLLVQIHLISLGDIASFEIIVSTAAVDQIESARLNVQSDYYSMMLTKESTSPASVQ